MPYSTLDELPEAVRSNLPTHGQEIFQSAFNSAFKGSCNEDEVCSNKVAWAAVKKAYHQDDNGIWLPNKCNGGKCFFGNAVKQSTHDAVLLTLNRWLTYGDKKFYNAFENFEGTEKKWETVPIIYAQDHPDPDLVDTDLGAALAGVKTAEGGPGVICGALKNTEVIQQGQPRMTTQVVFTDPVAEAHYMAGKLSLSIAHRAKEDKSNPGYLAGKVTPNHVLFFVQDDNNQPRDLGAMLNKEDNNVSTFENTGKVISSSNKSKFKTLLENLWNLFAEMGGDDNETLQNASPAVPSNPTSYKIGKDAPACKLTQTDFGEMPFGEIRQRFAYDDGSGNFTGLSLPHHYVNGDVAPNCVRAALQAIGGARSGQPMNLGGKEEAVTSHLQAHMDEINKGKQQMTDELEQKLKTAEEALANKTAEYDKLKAEVDRQAEALKTFEQARADTEWNTLKNKIPKGWLAGDKEPEVRKAYENDKPAFLNKLLDTPKGEPTKEEGTEFANKDGDNDPVAICRELRQSSGRMR